MARQTSFSEQIDYWLTKGRILNVRCSDHASIRACQRLSYTSPLQAAEELRETVRKALLTGRWGSEQPDWSLRPGDEPRPDHDERERWVWDAEERWAAPLVLGRRVWVIKTVLLRPESLAVAHLA